MVVVILAVHNLGWGVGDNDVVCDKGRPRWRLACAAVKSCENVVGTSMGISSVYVVLKLLSKQDSYHFDSTLPHE
jgi:hypothetical protein